MPRARSSQYWRTCPECKAQYYDRRALQPRKWFKCGSCGHVYHPDRSEDKGRVAQQVFEDQQKEVIKKTWLEKLMGE